jgi:uncharacterized membrane protein
VGGGHRIAPFTPGLFGIAAPLLALGFFGLIVVGAIAVTALIVRRNQPVVDQEAGSQSKK